MDSLATDLWKHGRVGGSRILHRAQDEEESAEFAALVERQARFLYRVAYSVVRNAQDAEDVVQEAFLKLYRTGAWKGMKEEKAYLARVAWRIAVERLPKREVRDEVEVELAARGDSPETSAVRGSEEALLRRMIDGLPEELRQVLVLSAMEEMTSREVAEVMGIPEGTVRTRVMRGKDELRRRYKAAMEVRR
jgi:RNA polymerase sigma-70 factor (ECF subfamily)